MTLVQYDLPEWLDVSRETQAKLESLLTLVAKWNRTINLVSAGSLADGWRRHILDSAQILPLSGLDSGRWVDIGSGAGFPGLVVAILAQDYRPDLRVALVESDRRKATFLSEASRQLGLTVDVMCSRVEALPDLQASIISARALAPLNKLLGDARRHLRADGLCLFMKGQNYRTEITDAQWNWTFDLEVISSLVEPEAVILKVREILDAKS